MPRKLSDKRRMKHLLRWAQWSPLVFHTPPFRWRREKPRGRGEGSARRGSLSREVAAPGPRDCHLTPPPGSRRPNPNPFFEAFPRTARPVPTLCTFTPGPVAPAAAAPGEGSSGPGAGPQEEP